VTIICRDIEISIARGVGEMVRVLSLGRFVFSFFCNHAVIVFRYKKPHAVRAMERTKPINPNKKQKKVTAPVNIHTDGGFSSAGPKATLTVRKVKSYNFYDRKAYIS